MKCSYWGAQKEKKESALDLCAQQIFTEEKRNLNRVVSENADSTRFSTS